MMRDVRWRWVSMGLLEGASVKSRRENATVILDFDGLVVGCSWVAYQLPVPSETTARDAMGLLKLWGGRDRAAREAVNHAKAAGEFKQHVSWWRSACLGRRRAALDLIQVRLNYLIIWFMEGGAMYSSVLSIYIYSH